MDAIGRLHAELFMLRNLLAGGLQTQRDATMVRERIRAIEHEIARLQGSLAA